MDKKNKKIPTKNVTYDPHLTPAETAARMKREGSDFQHVDSEDSTETTGGFTSDQEGLINNYAIEPEMYVNEPGDLREEGQENRQERQEELQEINQTSEQGELTLEEDNRGKGVGII
ncbi:hypothetical protein [Lyngbya confervoides]|uniref:Uncharacterized protein n=1 Tax=Lyngbya confervoides BDU141951 TaxID=1574623 RepID=A0ABD4SZF5_9CYAN|nr:hypothetical protein [Lyngbya confervoides]MCM1981697.1 hypothetical protein [Lyngbya confervoides BDU141951]